MLTVALFAGLLVAAVGVGYGVTRPFLGDGSAYLAKGHTVVHVNGETGKPDAEVAQQLATGQEGLQTVRLPDGRLAVVNKATGTVSIIDATTMTPDGPPLTPANPSPEVQALATTGDGYLVDTRDNTVQRIVVPGRPAAPPVPVGDGIRTAVPSAGSVWVLTDKGDILEVVDDRAVRTVRLGEPAAGLTVADGHPVAVSARGAAFVVDGTQPRGLGDLGLAGPDVVFGSHRGAGRHVVAVDRRSGRFGALDPRTGRRVNLALPLRRAGADLGEPIVLGAYAYVPDYSGPSLWRINLGTGSADAKPLEVPGQPGAFSLEVTGERVWANNQYDRRVLIVEANGHERYVDKGAGPDVTDSQGGGTGGGPGPAPESGSGNQPPATGGGPSNPGPATIPVPAFPPGTSRAQACAELARLKLRCREVAVGDQGSRPTDEVVDTTPAAGTLVPANTRVTVRYVGPLETPNVVGMPQTEACRLLSEGGRFACTARAATQPATDPTQLGKVMTQEPGPGSPLARGGRVTLTYADSIALPPFAGQTQGEACARITSYAMTCEPVEGTPGVGAGQVPGTVYDQQPVAGTVAATGTAVRVTFYSGEATVDTYVGRDANEACAAARAAGFGCMGQEGRTAAGTGQQPGYVYEQSHPAGAEIPLGTQLVLTYLSANNGVPPVTGTDPGNACAQLAAAGFGCQHVHQPYPSVNRVEAQGVAPGTVLPIGSAVPIAYSPWGLVQYSKYLHNSEPVWVLRPTGDIPAGYGRQAVVVGSAYPPGLGIPGAHFINGYFCSNRTSCSGLPVNHFYSRLNEPYRDWNGPNPIATFFGCEFGGRPIYRSWDSGEPKHYDITIGGQDGRPGPGTARLRLVTHCSPATESPRRSTVTSVSRISDRETILFGRLALLPRAQPGSRVGRVDQTVRTTLPPGCSDSMKRIASAASARG